MADFNRILESLEQVLERMGYELHYGKGHFKAGNCLVENQKKIVINQHFDSETKSQLLSEILYSLNWEEEVGNSELRNYILQMHEGK